MDIDRGSRRSPRVSVLMPTFKQGSFIRRAVESLRAQTLADWELIVVDDGSPDRTGDVVAPYLDDPRIRYRRLPRNEGLGAALNVATGLAGGRYLAYLPSDDLLYPDHLERLVGLLDARPDVYLAYGGVRWGDDHLGPTLWGEATIGREVDALAGAPPTARDAVLTNGNILALVQVVHRRDMGDIPWPTRADIVSDTLEPDMWRALLARDARFAYAGAVTCEWVDHPDQRHKIIAGAGGRVPAWVMAGEEYGLPRYRAHYEIGGDTWLNWQPSRGARVDERTRYGRFAVRRDLPAVGGLKILLVGELGWNPERIMAFEERGHKLYGLWVRRPQVWDAVGPFPYGNVEDILLDGRWADRVREIRPDVVYALLNWPALPLIGEVLEAALEVPVVFHFKEGPFYCQEHGLWPALMRALAESAGQVFTNPETFEWFQLATDGLLDPAASFILDGDLPKHDWMTDDWAPKLSARDGEIHTVCVGRPAGLRTFEAAARAGIHVHFYGFGGPELDRWVAGWAKPGSAAGFVHAHPAVEPMAWVPELSRYDAAWPHVFDSANGGDLRRARWDDLNLPARLGTYAAAGLPWILRDNAGSRVAVERVARDQDVGLLFADVADLADQLRDRPRLAHLTRNIRAVRRDFSFDAHVDDLVAFFRRLAR